jgi:hypothetical protein
MYTSMMTKVDVLAIEALLAYATVKGFFWLVGMKQLVSLQM